MTRRRRVPGSYTRALLVLPGIEDDWTEAEKNQAAVRNACAANLLCPVCGAEPEFYRTALDNVFRVVFEHEQDCPAGEEAA